MTTPNTSHSNTTFEPPHFEASLFGERALRIHTKAPPSPQLSQYLAGLGEHYRALGEVLDVAIGYQELVVYLSDECPNIEQFLRQLPLEQTKPKQQISTISLPKHHSVTVDYCGEDIAAVAAYCHLSEKEVIQIHQQNTYTVAMLGFQPYFPYLHGLDERLQIPRQSSPRTQVKGGAVAIAAGQAGIYPCDTPGGWHILGYCDPDACRDLRAGDTLAFNQQNKGKA